MAADIQTGETSEAEKKIDLAWSTLLSDLESDEPTPLELWRSCFERWKERYRRFKGYEEATFFTAAAGGEPAQPEPNVLDLHRRAVLALLKSGEEWERQLAALPLVEDEVEERASWSNRIDVLLDALRESLELWHPTDPERVTKLRRLAL